MHMLRKVLAAWILAATALAAQTAVADPTALADHTIEGHVVDSVTGVGIPEVAVEIFRDFAKVYAHATDIQGRFRIEDVEEGSYTVFYKAPNYQPARDGGSQFKVVKGAGPVRLEAAMIQTGRVSGRVLDGAGKPVPKAIIQLDHEMDNGGFRQVFDANESGEYSAVVLPGTLTLAASAPSSWTPPEPPPDSPGVTPDVQRLGWAQTFYPSVTSAELAAKIDVPAGGEVSKLDIKLAAVPVHRIRGVVLDLHGDPVPKLSVTLGAGGALGPPPLHPDPHADDGTFEFATVADGDWNLSTVTYKDGVRLWAHQKVQVKGRDLENIELRLTPPFSIQGKVVMEVPEGMPAPKPPSVMVDYSDILAALADRINVGGVFNPDGKGGFTATNLYPGSYEIQPGFLSPTTGPYYLDSIRLGERDALESVQIESGALPITITYKLNGGTVRGSVEACGAGEVLLIPQDPALGRDGFIHQTSCTQNGRFEIPAVRPGEYYAFALAVDAPAGVRRKLHGFHPELDQNLINQSVRITVLANEATLADLRLIKQ
jgi:hypothetical protein